MKVISVLSHSPWTHSWSTDCTLTVWLCGPWCFYLHKWVSHQPNLRNTSMNPMRSQCWIENYSNVNKIDQPCLQFYREIWKKNTNRHRLDWHMTMFKFVNNYLFRTKPAKPHTLFISHITKYRIESVNLFIFHVKCIKMQCMTSIHFIWFAHRRRRFFWFDISFHTSTFPVSMS